MLMKRLRELILLLKRLSRLRVRLLVFGIMSHLATMDIGKDGNLVNRFRSGDEPMGDDMIAAIEAALNS